MTAAPPRPPTASQFIDGPAGRIELLIDAPAAEPRGLALIAHPHPLLGGDAMHKVPHLLARTCRDLGWLAVRPNFRGVGGTEGGHDHGDGEADDLLAVIRAMQGQGAGTPLALLGFSFGAYVQARVAARLSRQHEAAAHVVLAGLAVGAVTAGRQYEPEAAPKGSVVVHGQHDEMVPLASVLEWAGRHGLPVTVIPGADHVFKGRLPMLRAVAEAALQRAIPRAP